MLAYIEPILVILLTLGIVYYYLKQNTNKASTELFSNILAPANPDIGIQPLILQNDEELPVIHINTSPLGSAGYFTARCLRKLVYPLDPIQTYPTQEQILANLEPDQLAIVREYVLLGSTASSTYEVLAPLYYELLICLANKYSSLTNIIDILKPKLDGTLNKMGVLRDSSKLFQVICKNRNIRLGLADTPFTLIIYDSMTELLTNLSTRAIDAIFVVTHPKDTVLQAYCNGNQVRLLDLEPGAENPDVKSPVPYNPDDENKLNEFREGVKRDVPWIFRETMSVDKLPNASLSALKGASRETGNITIERVVYNTYKVRSLLIYKPMGGLVLSSASSKHLGGLASRLVRQYQTIGQAFNSWNPIAGNDATADNTDLASFDFNQLATVPNSLKIAPVMLDELSQVGLIKRETVMTCRT